MAIDFDAITNEIIQIARDEVGTSLSSLRADAAGTTVLPSVIRARNNPKGNVPDLPYVVVDLLNVSTPNGWLLNECLDNTTDEVVRVVEKEILLRLTVRARDQWESNTIANNLEVGFNKQSYISRIKASGAALKSTEVIFALPEKLDTNFVGVSVFDIALIAHDETRDTSDGVIETITLDPSGNLCRFEGDTTPLKAELTVPIP